MANNLTPKEEFLLNPVTEHNITDAAIATFETNLRHGVKVEVPFTPKQDLHGYDHPWPPGGGKNLFDGYLENGGVSAANGGDINVNNRLRTDYIKITGGESYTVSVSGVNSFYYAFYDINKTIPCLKVSSVSNPLIAPSDAEYLRVSFKRTDDSDLTPEDASSVQIELGSTATAYEPYSNICPIEGYTECEVEHVWENYYKPNAPFGLQYNTSPNKSIDLNCLVPGVWLNALSYYNPSKVTVTHTKNGFKFTSSDMRYLIGYCIKVKPGMRLYVNFDGLRGVSAQLYTKQWEHVTVPGGSFNAIKGIEKIIPDNVYYCELVFVAVDTNVETSVENLIISVSGQSDNFEKYGSTSLPISWKHAEGTYEFTPVQEGSGDPSPENVRPIHPGLTITRDDNTELTVYGGSITFNDDGTSRVTEQYAKKVLDGSESWQYSNGTYNYCGTMISDIQPSNFGDGYCTDYPVTNHSDPSSTNMMVAFGWGSNRLLYLFNITKNYPDINSVSAVKEYISEHNFTIVYKLNTPITYTLSITETQRAIEALGDKVTTTIYDGTVTVNEDGSADAVSYAASIIFDGSNDEQWELGGSNNLFVAKAFGMKQNTTPICDTFELVNSSVYPFNVRIPINSTPVTTVVDLRVWLSAHNITVVYKLATPTTYHFPNVGKLKAFLGTNNIWSDIGNVNVKYLTQNSETGMEYRGDRALELRRRAMIADAPTIHTTTGSEETGGLVSFKSYVKAPVKKIEIPFKPKQDLHGYDHPWPAGGWKNLFNKDGNFVDHVVIKSETAYKLASGTGSAISTVAPGTTVLLNETIDGVTKLKPWIYLGLDESGNARLYREKVDDEPRQMDANTANVSYDGCDMDEYLTDETAGFLSRFDSTTLGALVATSIKYVDYFATGDNTASVQTISRKCFLPSYSEMGYGDDPAGNEGQSYLAVLKTYYENNTDNTVRIGKTEDRIANKTWLRSGQATANSRHRMINVSGAISWDNANATTDYVRPMISLDPNTLVETVTFGKDAMIQNTTLYTDPIAVSPSTAYALSGRCYTNQIMRVDEYDANDNFLRSTVSTAMNHPSISFTTTENTAYVLINPDWVIQFVQLEAGSAVTSYAPYSNICPIEGYSDGISYFESSKANIYGARWDRLQHRLTRYGAAADFDTDVTNFRINGEVSSSYDNPFDDLYPWSERKLCNINLAQYMALQNGSSITDCVTYWEGETGFSYDDPDGVWVYTPKFWGRSYDDANGHRCFEVSDRPVHDFIEYDEQITARWRGVVETRDINGASKQILLPTLGNPGRYTPVNTLHTYAKNYGGSVTSIYSIDPSYLLMIVEFASMNPRLDVGGGVNSLYRQNAADKIAENATDSTVIKLPNSYAAGMIPDALIDIGTANGGNQIGTRWIVSAELDEATNLWTVTLNESITVTTANFWSIHGMANRPDAAIGSKSGYLGENNRSHAYYRGEELWGNMYMYVIGAYKSARDEVWLCPKNLDPDDYSALNENVHVNTGVQLATASGWNREFGYPEKSHGLSAPALNVLNGGNATDPIGSYFYTVARGARILFVGGHAGTGTNVGFYWNWNAASSILSWHYGASPRLKNPPRGLSGGPQSP